LRLNTSMASIPVVVPSPAHITEPVLRHTSLGECPSNWLDATVCRYRLVARDAGRRADGNGRLHFLAGLPQRDDDELAGFVVGEEVEAAKPRPPLGTGDLVLGETDNSSNPSAPAWP
jgi:hypothetical protein